MIIVADISKSPDVALVLRPEDVMACPTCGSPHELFSCVTTCTECKKSVPPGKLSDGTVIAPKYTGQVWKKKIVVKP